MREVLLVLAGVAIGLIYVALAVWLPERLRRRRRERELIERSAREGWDVIEVHWHGPHEMCALLEERKVHD